jgi:hypothetical protein
MNMFDLWRMVAVGTVAIAIWEALDLLSPRLKVGLTAALMASQQSIMQSVGIIVILKVLFNAARNKLLALISGINTPIRNDDVAGA